MAERGTLVSGSFSATGQSATFMAILDQPFNITIYGTFVGTVRLERSFDAGTTWVPLTANGSAILSFTAPASESWSESGANMSYRMNCTAYTSGTINYRLGQ